MEEFQKSLVAIGLLSELQNMIEIKGLKGLVNKALHFFDLFGARGESGIGGNKNE